MKTLLAFHNNPELKEFYLDRLKAHAKADEMVKGIYWQNGKGCAVGCTIHGSEHNKYEDELGIPESLAHLEDFLFEGLSSEKAKTFPLEFLQSINVGADLSMVATKFKICVLSKHLQFDREQYPDIDKAVKSVIGLLSRRLNGDEPKESEWSAAPSAAWSALLARVAAWSPAELAARSAASATLSAARSATQSARSAAWSAQSSASAADAWSARSAAIEDMAKDLLRILEETK